MIWPSSGTRIRYGNKELRMSHVSQKKLTATLILSIISQSEWIIKTQHLLVLETHSVQ